MARLSWLVEHCLLMARLSRLVEHCLLMARLSWLVEHRLLMARLSWLVEHCIGTQFKVISWSTFYWHSHGVVCCVQTAFVDR